MLAASLRTARGEGTTEYPKTVAGLEIRAIVLRRKSNPQAKKWLHRAWQTSAVIGRPMVIRPPPVGRSGQ